MIEMPNYVVAEDVRIHDAMENCAVIKNYVERYLKGARILGPDHASKRAHLCAPLWNLLLR